MYAETTEDFARSISGDISILADAAGEPALLLRHLPAANGAHGAPVLYVHGATFPSALSVGFRFRGRSWLEDLSDAGFDAWSFDFAGFGGSERYAEMAQPAARHPPLGRAEVAARQIERVVRAIAARHGGRRVSLIAHSWGCIAAGLFATRHPHRVERLVFFGPIARRAMPGLPAPESIGAWRLLSIREQHDRFVEDVPPGADPVLELADFEAWAAAYLATDPQSATRNPPSVQVPAGPAADILAAWRGDLAYDPGRIAAPLLVVRGAWDSLTTDADAAWLLSAAAHAPRKEDVKIPRATHLMHLETGRSALYRAAAAFLSPSE